MQEIEEKKEREGGADVDGNQTRDDRRRGASLFQTRNEYFKKSYERGLFPVSSQPDLRT